MLKRLTYLPSQAVLSRPDLTLPRDLRVWQGRSMSDTITRWPCTLVTFANINWIVIIVIIVVIILIYGWQLFSYDVTISFSLPSAAVKPTLSLHLPLHVDPIHLSPSTSFSNAAGALFCLRSLHLPLLTVIPLLMTIITMIWTHRLLYHSVLSVSVTDVS